MSGPSARLTKMREAVRQELWQLPTSKLPGGGAGSDGVEATVSFASTPQAVYDSVYDYDIYIYVYSYYICYIIYYIYYT